MTSDNSPSPDIEAGQEWQVLPFTPEDAPGVVNLFRSVYGEGYPVRTYLDESALIAENAAGRVISSVAKTPRGEVVGHNALFNSAPFPGTYESGAGVVHAAYRGGLGIFSRMVSHGLAMAGEMPKVQAIFGEPVCNHPFSQKMSVKVGWVPRALEVDLMPAAAYHKEASAAGRVAAFLDFCLVRPRPHAVYLPARYSDDLRFFYENLDDERDFRTSTDQVPAGTVSDMQPQIFVFAAVARVAVQAIGEDFSSRLDALEADLRRDGVQVTQLWLKLDCPWVGAATRILRERGYFIGGVLPRWFDTDGLLMQKVSTVPDWQAIIAVNDRYAQVLDRVQADWQGARIEK